MSIQVSIIKGYYRGEEISGVFPLIKPYAEGSKGGFVTIRNPAPKAGTPPVQRIQVEKGAFSLLDASGEELGEHHVVEVAATASGSKQLVTSTDYETAFVSEETEEEAMTRINETFEMLETITDACARGTIRGLVVSGPPGIGKSFGVAKQLEIANLAVKLAGAEPSYEIISGGVSAIGLYQKLYYNRGSDRVLVFDDCDGVLMEEECLTLMKAALNSGDTRRICWNKESRVLASDNIPEAFNFNGSVIFLSNIDFERTIARGSRIADHLGAIMSRCHYLDLEIGSLRDRLLRIKQIVRDGMLDSYDFTPEQEKEVLNFVLDNAEYLREVSLRMVKKIADFVKSQPVGWLPMAEATCLQRDAKFKRLLDKRTANASKLGIEMHSV